MAIVSIVFFTLFNTITVQAASQESVDDIIADVQTLKKDTKTVLHYGFLSHYVIHHLKTAKRRVRKGYVSQTQGKDRKAIERYQSAIKQLTRYQRKIRRLAQYGWINDIQKTQLLAQAQSIIDAITQLINKDVNTAPVANAGSDISAIITETVQLDGSGSTDADGDALSYAWVLINTPAGSTAVLSGADSLTPTLIPDRAGLYEISLTVNDGELDSAPDTVWVNVGGMNTMPVADAGTDQQVEVDETVVLDGSTSSDVDGDQLSFLWNLDEKPAGSAASIAGSDQVNPSLVPDVAGQYDISLIVNDGFEASLPDSVLIQAEQGNTKPIANAGDDQSTLVNSTITLSGADSTDVDDDSLSYAWSILTKPVGSDVGIVTPALIEQNITIDVFGQYVFQLIVNDGQQDSDPDTVVVTTQNSIPMANAGDDQFVYVSDEVQLNGNASTDVDGDALIYDWSLTVKPENSSAVLNDANSSTPSLVVDAAGEYVGQLIVNDGTSDSAPDTVSISTINTRPVAGAGIDQTVLTEDTVELNGSASTDADGDDLTYRWAILSKPAFSQAQLSSSTEVQPSITTDEVGLYVVQLAVNDGQLDSELSTVTIRVESAQALTIELTSPEEGLSTSQADIEIVGAVSRRGVVTLGNTIINLNNDFTFTTTVQLTEGQNALSFLITDALGDTDEATLTLTLDTTAPNSVNTSLVTVTAPNGNGFVSITGDNNSAEAGSTVRITNDRTGESVIVTADQYGAFSVLMAAEAGDTFTITATDATGNQSSEAQTQTGSDNLIPPNPETVTPEPTPGNITPMGERMAFLYEGNNAIQTGVDTEQLDSNRTAVISGKILQDNGQPLSGVLVTIKDHPEYGQTVSRLDGEYDLVVNGGSHLVVNYLLEGYLPVQRQLKVDWIDHRIVDDLTMIAYDEVVTTIDLLDDSVAFHVGQSSMSDDVDGQRQATVLFPSGSSATMTLPDGSQQTLTTINFRATEYTVGTNGPQRMPASLPPTSAYTYAVDLTIDEAIAAGATRVDFSQPLPFYVDNFLDFPVGGVVPIGWYDFDRAAWVPSNDGVVIKILRIENGQAVIDVTADDVDNGATPEQLLGLNVTEEELRRLASLYSQGKTLWRSMIDHFTPWDCNWPYAPPEDAIDPPAAGPTLPPVVDVPIECSGCIIQPETQTLAEEMPVTGTPFMLRYQSDRMVGRTSKQSFTIPVSEDSVPESVKAIEIVVDVAGRQFRKQFPAEPNIDWEFTWDGLDRYGREVKGSPPAQVSLSYAYNLVYTANRSIGAGGGSGFNQNFGRVGRRGVELKVSRGSIPFKLVRRWQVTLGSPHLPDSNRIGGLSFNHHHVYDAESLVVYKGDGTKISTQTLNNQIDTTGGSSESGYAGDGGPVSQARFSNISAIEFDQYGNQYLADTNNNRIRKIDVNGVVTTIAGIGTNGFSGDGGLAINASLSRPQGLSVAADGSIFIADSGNHVIRKIDRQGIITTVAGNNQSGYVEDDVNATETQLNTPKGVTAAPSGGFYIADTGNHRIRFVDVNGVIASIAGTDENGFSGDGESALQAKLLGPTKVKLLQNGSLLVVDEGNDRVRMIDRIGNISTFAGGGNIADIDVPMSVASAKLNAPTDVAVDSADNVFISAQSSRRVYKVSSTGTISTFAGRINSPPVEASSSSGAYATSFNINNPRGVVVSSNNRLVIGTSSQLHRVQPVLLDDHSQEETVLVSSKGGGELYEFDQYGKHLRTISSITGQELFVFAYNSQGQLISITDIDGDVTEINRAANGNPVSIVSQDGLVTRVELDANGFINKVIDPLNQDYQLTYTNGGLLTQFSDLANNTWNYEYNDSGLLIKDTAPNGGGWELTRTQHVNEHTVAMTSGENRVTQFKTDRLPDNTFNREITAPDGTQTKLESFSNGSIIETNANGVVNKSYAAPDPRLGMQSAYNSYVTSSLPSGLFYEKTVNRTVTGFNIDNLTSFDTLTSITRINNREYRSDYNQETKTLLTVSPQNRQQSNTFDDNGRLVMSSPEGFASTIASYDSRGRLQQVQVGTAQDGRKLSYSYNNQGYLSKITDPFNRELLLEKDALGRVVKQTHFDGRETQFTWDTNNNLVAIQPPGRDLHVFDYDSMDQQSDYTPPNLSGVSTITRYIHNKDNQVTQIQRPDNQSIDYLYNAVSGKLDRLLTDQHTTDFVYDSTTGQLNSVEHSLGGTINYQWDGFLLEKETVAGEITGEITRSYDNNFWLKTLTVNGDSVGYSYDQDGLLTLAGDLSLSRNATTGLVDSTKLMGIDHSVQYNTFGEPTQISYLSGQSVAGNIQSVIDVSDSGRVYYLANNKVYSVDADAGNGRFESELTSIPFEVIMTVGADGAVYYVKDGEIHKLLNGVDESIADISATYIRDMEVGYDGKLLVTNNESIFRIDNGVLNEVTATPVNSAEASLASSAWGIVLQVTEFNSQTGAGVQRYYWFNDDDTLILMHEGNEVDIAQSDSLLDWIMPQAHAAVFYGSQFQVDHQGRICAVDYSVSGTTKCVPPTINLASIPVFANDEVVYNFAGEAFDGNGRLYGYSQDSVFRDQAGSTETEEVELYNDAQLLGFVYTYDQLGRIVTKTEQVQGGSTTVFAYTYNQANRLVSVEENGNVTNYSYDLNGNRTEGMVDEQDRLLIWGNSAYSYNMNGDLESKTENGVKTSYSYDVSSSLLQVILPSDITIDYVVDGQGRRIGKKVNGALTQGFLYQDQLNPVAELDGNGSVVTRFVYANQSNVPAYMVKAGQTYRIITDHLGSPRLVVDAATGVVAQAITYDVWGKVLTDTNPGFQPFGFAGGIRDLHTELVRFGARDYDPDTARWTNKDPIGFAGGDTNLYGYVANDPVNFIDPLGLSEQDVNDIHKIFNDTINQMTNDGLRHQNSIVNNALSTTNAIWYVDLLGLTENYKVCYEQTSYVNERLKKLDLDDVWEFSMQNNEDTRGLFNPGHYWGEANSSNPNDPSITYDPLKNIFSIDYSK